MLEDTDNTLKITGPESCVGCGYCCRQSSCPYGKWDADRHQCTFLALPNDLGQRLCLLYVEIQKDSGSIMSPGFGAGCSSREGNTCREDLFRKIDPLKWILWTFSPGFFPDKVFLTYTADVADEALRRSEANGEPVTEAQKEAVVVFRGYINGIRNYEDVKAARASGWDKDEIEGTTSARILFVGALLMGSLELILRFLVGMGYLFEDDRWLADHLYEVLEEYKKVGSVAPKEGII